jgi:protoporphyrin/coproporphyrin ferrochelatase
VRRAPSVVLVNLGTTAAPEPEAVRRFLAEFLSDPRVVDYPSWIWKPILARILRSRPERVAEQYRSIWREDGSPLEAGTRRIADGLSAAFRGEVDVSVAYRYGEPSLASALAERDGTGIVIPLFPQRTGSTTGTIAALVGDRAVVRAIAPADPGYVEAQAELFARTARDRPPDHFVVSFHGIPVRYDRSEQGRYRRDCEATFDALLKRIGWPESRSTLAYQSRFGPEPWIGPRTARVLAGLGRRGVGTVAVATPGFLTEGLETAEEIGIRGKKTFLDAGGSQLLRIPCVEDHPAFVASLSKLVREAFEAGAESESLKERSS